MLKICFYGSAVDDKHDCNIISEIVNYLFSEVSNEKKKKINFPLSSEIYEFY